MQFNVIGRLAKDPEFKVVNTLKILNINVISNEKTKVNQEWRERSDGFYCTLYGPLGETMYNNQTFGKGDLVNIQGRIRNDSYVKNGVTIYRDVYIIDKIERLISMRNQNRQTNNHPISQIDSSYLQEQYQPVQNSMEAYTTTNDVVLPTGSEVDGDVPF